MPITVVVRSTSGEAPSLTFDGPRVVIPDAPDGSVWAITVDLGDPAHTSQTVEIALHRPTFQRRR